MTLTNLRLYSIVFTDSLCAAFLPPIMATHLVSLGGNHSILGMVAAIHSASQLISGPLIHTWNGVCGRKSSLLLSLLVYFLTYFLLGITTSWVIFILLRVCFALTHQTQTLCKGIAATVNAAHEIECVNNKMNIIGIIGLIIGPIIGGLVFDNIGFYEITVIGSALLALSFCISLTLPSQSATKETTTFTEKIAQDVIHPFRNFFRVGFFNDLVLLKVCYMISLTIFFIKFSFALRLNQGLSFTTIGYTYAYQSFFTFVSTLVANCFMPPDLTNRKFLGWLSIVFITLSILCNTDMYLLYLISFVIMAIAHAVIICLFKEQFADNKISDVEDSITKVISVVIPAVFGISCDYYGLAALNAFVIAPIFCDIFMVFVFIIFLEEKANTCANKKTE